MRWIGEGVIEKTDYIFTAVKRETDQIFWTGLIINKRIKHLIMDFKAKSSRMCWLRIKGQFFNYSITCVHTPTEDKNEEEKDVFCDNLDKTYEECPGRDVKIIIGDLNAKTDKEDSYRPTIGKYSAHTKSNDSGIRLINFASSRNMVTGSTMFDHKDIHKMTWKSPERNTFNQPSHNRHKTSN
jgi:hypothetical protein